VFFREDTHRKKCFFSGQTTKRGLSKIPLTTKQKCTFSSKEKIDGKYKPPRSGGRGVPRP